MWLTFTLNLICLDPSGYIRKAYEMSKVLTFFFTLVDQMVNKDSCILVVYSSCEYAIIIPN